MIQKRAFFILAIAILAVSMAAILVRVSDAPALIVAAYRMLFASIFLLPISLRALSKAKLNKEIIGLAVLAGFFLAIHFATWISSLYFTSVAASVTIVATTPLWVTLFNWLFFGKAPSFMVLLGVLVAIAGGALIGFGDFGFGSAPLLGDLLALLGAIAAAAYLLLGRLIQHRGISLNAYVAMAYGSAAIFLLPLPFFAGLDYFSYSRLSFLVIVLLALIPQMVGHTGINYAMKHIDPTVVATIILFEPVISTVLAFLVFKEAPTITTIFGALVLLAGVAITVSAKQSKLTTKALS